MKGNRSVPSGFLCVCARVCAYTFVYLRSCQTCSFSGSTDINLLESSEPKLRAYSSPIPIHLNIKMQSVSTLNVGAQCNNRPGESGPQRPVPFFPDPPWEQAYEWKWDFNSHFTFEGLSSHPTGLVSKCYFFCRWDMLRAEFEHEEHSNIRLTDNSSHLGIELSRCTFKYRMGEEEKKKKCTYVCSNSTSLYFFLLQRLT